MSAQASAGGADQGPPPRREPNVASERRARPSTSEVDTGPRPIGETEADKSHDRSPSRLTALRSTDRDRLMCHRAIVIRSGLTFSAMLLCYLGHAPWWALFLVNAVLYPEIYLRVHDIGHASAPARFGWSARFIPVTNPIWGGTRAFALVHREHHAHLGTNDDPWLPYYAGHPLRALFFNFIEPEYSCRQFIRRYGVDSELIANVAYNLVCLAGGVFFFRHVYLAHLLGQRVVHALGIFFFNFYTHRATLSASAPIGTWERAAELAPHLPVLRAIWGRDTIDGLIYHNRHHCLGQQHIPVQNYKHLADTGTYTRLEVAWPLAEIRKSAFRE